MFLGNLDSRRSIFLHFGRISFGKLGNFAQSMGESTFLGRKRADDLGLHWSTRIYAAQHHFPPMGSTEDLRILPHHPYFACRPHLGGIHHALASSRQMDLPRNRSMGRRPIIPYLTPSHPQQTLDRHPVANSRQSPFNSDTYPPHPIHTQDLVPNSLPSSILVGRTTFLCRHAWNGEITVGSTPIHGFYYP